MIKLKSPISILSRKKMMIRAAQMPKSTQRETAVNKRLLTQTIRMDLEELLPIKRRTLLMKAQALPLY